MLPGKNRQVAQAESWRTWPGRGSEASFRDSHTGACVPQRFICRTGRVGEAGPDPPRQTRLDWKLRLTSTQAVGISAGWLWTLNLYQPGSSEWSQTRSWMAVFWISVESKATLRLGFRSVRWPLGEHSGAARRSDRRETALE